MMIRATSSPNPIDVKTTLKMVIESIFIVRPGPFVVEGEEKRLYLST